MRTFIIINIRTLLHVSIYLSPIAWLVYIVGICDAWGILVVTEI